MKISLLAAALIVTGAPALAQTAAEKPEVEIAAEKSKLDAYADKQRAELIAFIEAAKEELDGFAARETVRLETVTKRIKSDALTDAEQAKIAALQELMVNSSPEMRKSAQSDLRDNIRAERVKAIWTKYKAKKKAAWVKFTQDWQKLLTQPPLMIKKS